MTIVIAVIIFCVVGISIFFIQKRSGILDKTLDLLKQLESSTEKVEIRNIYCSTRTFGSWGMEMYNVYFFNDCIVITTSADFDLRREYRQKYLTTYLLTSKKTKRFPDQLFRNIIKIEKVDIAENGEIKIVGNCSTQSVVFAPGEFVGNYNLTIGIKTNFDKKKLIDKLTSKQIEINNWC